MALLSFLVVLVGLSLVATQTTYTGCHNHSNVEWCYGPDGEETPLATYTLPSSSSTVNLPVSVPASTTTTAQTASVTGCHNHGADIYCINGAGKEVLISLTATPTGEPPAQYTDCHSHDTDMYCVSPAGEDVLVVDEGVASSGSSSSKEGEESSSSGQNCHFHAGVEHCVGAGESESESESSCEVSQRDYDVPLRIGSIFVVLVTSAIGIFAPILFTKLSLKTFNTMVSVSIKQFGTGVIIATAFVHLYTHASLMFSNECLGELQYEATTSAIVIAGIFIAFLTEYIGHRVVSAQSTKAESAGHSGHTAETTSGNETLKAPPAVGSQSGQTLLQLGHHHGTSMDPTLPNSKLSVLIMEAGILFHSILIGLTLVVAGDSFYKTLLVVIVFHQFFEGMALGARIALLPGAIFPSKVIMGTAFALITPIGMAIGLGVLNSFNGNDASTLIALGTLDALSSGILIWNGVVDMWARDWIIEGGQLLSADIPTTLVGGLSLVGGLILMSVLGKWA
ncbi:hypothetical protein DTO169E5_9074 [Paecilomyces variotii]|nr:hypothetical protein DTO169E5_9074 [Paecilomyces variotii]